MHSKSPDSGFSLIEVVIAIAVAGISFFLLTETFFNILLTLDSLEAQSDYQKDVRFVRREIIQIADRDELEDGGEITTLDLGQAVWEVELEETEIVDLFNVDIFIEFENPEGEPITAHPFKGGCPSVSMPSPKGTVESFPQISWIVLDLMLNTQLT